MSDSVFYWDDSSVGLRRSRRELTLSTKRTAVVAAAKRKHELTSCAYYLGAHKAVIILERNNEGWS